MREVAGNERDAGMRRAILAGLYAVSLGLHVWAARSLGVAAGEGARLRAAMDASQIIAAYRAHGLGALTRAAVDQSLASGKPSPLLPTMLSGGLWQVLADHDGRRLDSLTALRLGGILVTAAIAPLVFLLARSSLGTPLAVAAALFSLLVPRGIEQGTILSGDGVLSALLLATLVTHVRSLKRGSWRYGVLAGALLGLSMSVSFAAILLVPVLVAHDAMFSGRSSARLRSQGELPVSGAIAWLPLSGAATFFVAQPYLWRETFERVRDLVIASASPRVGAGLWRDVAPPIEAIPRGHAITMMLASLPSLTAILAVVALAAIVVRFWSERPISPALGLAAAMTGAILGWPLISPPALAGFPSRWVLALPYVGILAAYGALLVITALRSKWPTLEALPLRAGFLAAMLLPALVASFSPSTSSSSFPLLGGGARHAARAHVVPLHDGTPIGSLAAMIDAAARDGSTVYAPDVPPDVWEWMLRLGRLHVRLRPVPAADGADLLVLTGDVPEERLRGASVTASVEREGQRVLTLVRR